MTIISGILLINNKYKIIRQLGQGGMAQVWLAEEIKMGNRQAAIKVQLPGISDQGNQILQARFQREIEVSAELAKADTTNVVKALTVEPFEDGNLLIMEYMVGGDLEKRINDHPLGMPVEDVIKIAKEILIALDAIHNHPLGIIHRDIKPSNILFNAKGEACLGDFGLAQIGRTAGQLSGALSGQVLVFTPRYRAPELDNPNAYINTAADIFSFGCVMWEMLTGKVYKDYGKSASTFNNKIPAWLDNILNRCLEKNPQDRFLIAKEILDSINKHADETGRKVPEKAKPKKAKSTKSVKRDESDTFDEPTNNILERILFKWKKLQEKEKITLVVAITTLMLVSFLVFRFLPLTATGTKSTKTNGTDSKQHIDIVETSSSIISKVDRMRMVYVPAGEFIMGSQDGKNDELPMHTVNLDAYYIDQTEVTYAQFKLCVKAGACDQPDFNNYYQSTYLNHPVVNVSWNDADAYCQWAGRQLPTEAQWEKAARGTDGRTYPWGEGIDCDRANYSACDDFSQTSPVGYSGWRGASPYSAWDMAGNVWEWVADWYDSDYYLNAPSANPTGPISGTDRVLRGGSWYNHMNLARASYRHYKNPDDKYNFIGFRCALSP